MFLVTLLMTLESYVPVEYSLYKFIPKVNNEEQKNLFKFTAKQKKCKGSSLKQRTPF